MHSAANEGRGCESFVKVLCEVVCHPQEANKVIKESSNKERCIDLFCFKNWTMLLHVIISKLFYYISNCHRIHTVKRRNLNLS